MLKQRLIHYIYITIVVCLMVYQIYKLIGNMYYYTSDYISSIVSLLFYIWMLVDSYKRNKEKYDYQKFQKETAEKARQEKEKLEEIKS